jgi:predicted histidine transporter YuiF (NhaC family)
MKSDFNTNIAAQRARLEHTIAVHEEAIVKRLKALKAEIDTRLDVEAIVRQYALPVTGVALLAGFLIGRSVASARPAQYDYMQTKKQPPASKNTRSSKFLNTVLRAMLGSAKTLALNYASDFAARKLQEWLTKSGQGMLQTNSSPKNHIN